MRGVWVKKSGPALDIQKCVYMYIHFFILLSYESCGMTSTRIILHDLVGRTLGRETGGSIQEAVETKEQPGVMGGTDMFAGLILRGDLS